MLGFMILKIMTTLVLTVLAISALWYAPKQKTASDGVIFYLRSQCSLHLE